MHMPSVTSVYGRTTFSLFFNVDFPDCLNGLGLVLRSLQHRWPPSLITTGLSWRWSSPPSFFIFSLSTQPPLGLLWGLFFWHHIMVSTGSQMARSGIGEKMELLLLRFTQWWIIWPCLIILKHIHRGQIFIPDLRPLIWWRPDLKAPSKEPFYRQRSLRCSK